MTYPRPETQRFLREQVVAFRAHVEEEAELAQRFDVRWTPGLLWLTPRGAVAHRNVGYFEPEEFLAECLYGCAQVAVAQDDWSTARARFEETARRWPNSHAAPAAMYWAGVAGMKATGSTDELVRAWRELLAARPDDAWAMKVSFLADPARRRPGRAQ